MSTPAKKGFIPPQFSKFGINAKDLFKKKYDFDYTVKAINKANNGVTIESGATAGQPPRGFIKPKYVNSDFGEIEGELNTDPKLESKAILRLKKLATGLSVNLTGSNAGKKGKGVAEVTYAQDYFATQSIVTSNFETSSIDASASVGFDGFSLGGQVVLDVSKGAEVSQANVGAEWSQSDLTATVYTERNSDIVNGALFHKINRDTSVGAKLSYELSGKQSRVLSLGVEHQLDFDTSLKAYVQVPNGTVSTAIEHRLISPKLQFGVAASFNALQQPFQAEKFGLTLTFGDY